MPAELTASPQKRQQVLDRLETPIKTRDDLLRLFVNTLGYQRIERPIPITKDTFGDGIVLDLAQKHRPLRLAEAGTFHIIYTELDGDRLDYWRQRILANQLLKSFPDALFVFTRADTLGKPLGAEVHLVNVKYDTQTERRRVFRRFRLGQGEHYRTTAERLALMDITATPDIGTLELRDRLDTAFDVEAVTAKFYTEIANWYFWAREHATFPKDAPVDADGKPSLALIRLLTRLIFCWFLRRKRNPQTNEGLLPDVLFEVSGIRQVLKDASPEARTYYPAILQNLFFATLNTEMDKTGTKPNRRFIEEGDGQRSDDHMIHTLWRHTRLLRDPDAFDRLLRGVPFLNGGLFECLDDRVQKGKSTFTEEIRIDGFSSDLAKQPKLPNFLFFGPDQVVNLSSTYGDSTHRRESVSPLLTILNRYNFTLTENTPLEQEVALDPELLGHVFENLLAAYNPETGIVARNATGSFYTPRVVVDWMVDQALLVYLSKALARANKTAAPDKPDERLHQLLSWEDTPHGFSSEETEVLIDAIDHLKAIDLACGSGAFPMGLLQKLVHVLRKLDPENDGWRRRQEAALDTFDSAPTREEAAKAIHRAFARDNDDYGRKLYLIENCLYGVDIQPIACQIAKLRFFIALIVDQTIDPKEPNYGILPLPNLETKIVAANSLLGLQRGQLLLGSDRVRQLEKQLQQVRHDYFTARRYKDKKALRARDKELCAELATALTDGGECSPYDAKRLAEWNPYDTNKEATFFDPAWMFGLPTSGHDDKGVFHLVIGNPPYVRQEQLRNISVTGSDGKPRPLKDVLKELYECYTGTADLYVYFFERSFQLLHIGGVLSFITSNKYMRAAYGERLRTYLFYATHPRVILDFGDSPVFTSVAYPCILVTEKTRHVGKGQLPSSQGAYGVLHPSHLPPEEWNVRVHTWNPGGALLAFPDIFDSRANTIEQRDLKPDGWRLESPVSLRLLDRLRISGQPLGKFVNDYFFRGVTSGLNEAFIINGDDKQRLIREDQKSAEMIKPFIRGKNVKRWSVDHSDAWLLFIPWHFPLHGQSGITGASKEAEREFARRYRAVYEHLNGFRKDLEKRNKDETGIRYEWYALQRWGADFAGEFPKPKIVYPELSLIPEFAFDHLGLYVDCTVYFIPDRQKALLGVLNSNVSRHVLDNISPAMRGGFRRFKAVYMEQLPIPPMTAQQQKSCEQLVEALILLHGQDATKKTSQAPFGLMKSYFEQWLNGLVYELFFPGELHARNLKLFDETARLNPPDLSTVPEQQKVARLQELFTKAHDGGAPLRAMLFDLPSLEVVRIIEDAISATAVIDAPDEE